MTNSNALESEQEVLITRVFDAPAELVFNLWIDPELLIQWYAPEGCTIFFKEINPKTGGSYHSCISNSQYGDCWCIGKYKEVIPNTKIAFTMINADEHGNPINPAAIGMDPEWPGETLVTIRLEEEEGRTKLELRQTVSQELAKKTGAYPSWLQMLDNMQSLLS